MSMVPDYFQFLLMLVLPLLLAVAAQWFFRDAYGRTGQIAATGSGFAAARQILDRAGLHAVEIEQVPGRWSDHYDARQRVLRLSQEVYHGRTLAAVGIAGHNAGHALQDATGYPPRLIRHAAVPAAGFGSSLGLLLVGVGLLGGFQWLLALGMWLFGGVFLLQVVNLPAEFNASRRAEQQLLALNIVAAEQRPWLRRLLCAAALSYIALTVQGLLSLGDALTRYIGRAQ